MRKSLKLALIAFSGILVLNFCLTDALARGKKRHKRCNKKTNIIFMIPDGMGLSYVTAARIFKNGPDGESLNLEMFPQVGYQRTYAADATVTDSAAGASAWASGEKFNNNEVSCHDDNGDGECERPIRPTILELAKKKGMATGLVATSTITHGTPGAFGTHVHNRGCETEVGRQLLTVTKVDVLLGGGIGADNVKRGCLTPSSISADELIALAQSDYGYTYVTTKEELESAVSKRRVLGLFPNERIVGPRTVTGKAPETFRVDPSVPYPEDEPTLAEMTDAALDILEEDCQGFFLMVEGSQIDWAGHSADSELLFSEMLGFDEAVGVVQDWIDACPSRSHNTLVIIVADHETGGVVIEGPAERLSEPGDKDQVEFVWALHKGGPPRGPWAEHSGVDTVIWSRGPGSEYLGTALDNTDLYDIMASTLFKRHLCKHKRRCRR